MSGIHPSIRANARRLRKEMTPEERKLWGRLRELNHSLGAHFRRQAPIGPLIADFAEFGRRLVIEVDGGGHGEAEGVRRDIRRDEWLSVQGFQVLRFWNSEVTGNLDGVMQMVLDALEPLGDPPPPQPSPTRGEGGARREPVRGAADASASPPPRGEGVGVGGTPPVASRSGEGS